MLKVLDLFSGIGGFSLGLERTGGFKTVAFCEIEPFCRRVLAKHWPNVPIYDDVRTLTADRLRADGISVDVICGGFPCQDISSSGDKKGIDEGQRSGLWREFHRLICDIRPNFAIVENVSDLLSRGLGDVLGDLASSGYDAEWHSIPASFVGLPQARERVWIIAYPDGRGREWSQELYGQPYPPALGSPWLNDDRLDLAQYRARDARSWVSRANDGIPNRVHRVRAIGNAVVPQIPEIIGQAILKAEVYKPRKP